MMMVYLLGSGKMDKFHIIELNMKLKLQLCLYKFFKAIAWKGPRIIIKSHLHSQIVKTISNSPSEFWPMKKWFKFFYVWNVTGTKGENIEITTTLKLVEAKQCAITREKNRFRGSCEKKINSSNKVGNVGF